MSLGPEYAIRTMLLDALGLTEREFVQHESRFLLFPRAWLREHLVRMGWTPPPGK